MTAASARNQRGITFFGLLFVAAVLGTLAVVLAQVLPTCVEYFAVQKAVHKAAGGQTPEEVRTIFNKAAAIDNISSIKADDLDIARAADGRVQVRFSYQREIHLAGPAYLTMKYAGQSN